MDIFNLNLFKDLKHKLKYVVKVEEGLFKDMFIVTHLHSNHVVILTKDNINVYLLAIFNSYDLEGYNLCF